MRPGCLLGTLSTYAFSSTDVAPRGDVGHVIVRPTERIRDTITAGWSGDMTGVRALTADESEFGAA